MLEVLKKGLKCWIFAQYSLEKVLFSKKWKIRFSDGFVLAVGHSDDAIKWFIFSGKWLHAHAVKRPGVRALPWRCICLTIEEKFAAALNTRSENRELRWWRRRKTDSIRDQRWVVDESRPDRTASWSTAADQMVQKPNCPVLISHLYGIKFP